MKTCLVLEGGGLRGIYTAGVLDSLLKENIQVDSIIGVSMGALVGINYVSKQPERALRINLKYCKDRNYIGFYAFLKTGNIVNKDLAYYKIPEYVDPFDNETFKKANIDFYCTVTNLETGEAEYIKTKDAFKDTELLRATSSLPAVSKIIEINGNKYLDGGIADSIPVEKALEMGFDRVVVVLTRPITYRKKPSKQKLLSRLYKDYPKFVKDLQNRNNHYNETVEKIIELEKENKVFVIRPSIGIPIKRLEHNKKIIQRQYDLGVKDFTERKEALENYLKEQK